MLHIRSVQLVLASALVALAGCANSTARSSAPTSPIAARTTVSLAPTQTASPRAPTVPASTVTQPPAPTSAEPPSPTADTLSAMATLSALVQPTLPPTLPPTSDPATLPTVSAATTSTLLRLPLRLKTGTQIEQIAISPEYASDHTILIAASDQRLYRSTDAGTSWKSQLLGVIQDIAFSTNYANDHSIFVGLIGDSTPDSPKVIQVQQSADRGQSWQALSSPGTVPLLGGMRLFISPAYAQDHTLFTTLFGTSGLLDDPVVGNLYRSVDTGASWTHIDTPCQAHQLAISPTYQHDQTLYVGCYAVGRSSSNGLGLHRSSDNGASWQRLTWDAVSDLMLAPTTPQPTLFMHGTRSTDGGATWAGPKQNIGSAITMIVSPDYASDHTLFALAWRNQNDSSTQGLLRSIDSGDTWTSLIADLKTSAERPGVGIAVGRATTNTLIVLFSHNNELWKVSE